MTETHAYPWLAHYPANIHWDAALKPHPLYRLLDEAAEAFGSRPGIDFMDRTFTFREIADKATRLAAALQGIGVGKGHRVGLFLPNCPQFVIAYYAILKAGGIVVNFNPLYSAKDIKHQIEDAGTEIMFTLSLNTLYPKLKEFIGTTPLKTVVVCDLQEALPLYKGLLFPFLKKNEIAEVPQDANHKRFSELLNTKAPLAPVAVSPEQDVAVLQYTGGTTGTPKGTMLTHANLYINALQMGLWFEGLKPGEERVLGALPLFHVFAMAAVMNLAVHKGATMILHPRFDMKAVLEDIEKKKPTLMPGVPTMFAAINNYRSLDKYNLSSLKMCISGGAPLPLEVKQRFEQVTGCKLVEGYGLTESAPVAAVNPLFGKNKSGSIGLPVPGTILEVISLEDHITPMKTKEVGEICIRGPQVMKGYWQKPEDTAQVLRGDRLHTGDVGYVDEEGYFFIVDRLKELILVGGYNVYPRNIEEEIYKHPDVLEAAVIGVPDPLRGQIVKAYVVKQENSLLDGIKLKQFLRDKLAPFAQPSRIEFRTALPKTLIGKIAKKELLAEEMEKKHDVVEEM